MILITYLNIYPFVFLISLQLVRFFLFVNITEVTLFLFHPPFVHSYRYGAISFTWYCSPAAHESGASAVLHNADTLVIGSGSRPGSARSGSGGYPGDGSSTCGRL